MKNPAHVVANGRIMESYSSTRHSVHMMYRNTTIMKN